MAREIFLSIQTGERQISTSWLNELLHLERPHEAEISDFIEAIKDKICTLLDPTFGRNLLTLFIITEQHRWIDILLSKLTPEQKSVLINLPDDLWGDTAIHYAAGHKTDDVNLLKKLILIDHCSVAAFIETENTALKNAVMAGNKNITQFLIDLNVPLSPYIYHLLLSNNQLPLKQSIHNPLLDDIPSEIIRHIAALCEERVRELLISQDDEIRSNHEDIRCFKNKVYLKHINWQFWEAVSHNLIKHARYYLISGADVNEVHEYFRDYPIHKACSNGDLKMVQTLIEFGADIYVKNSSDLTTLHCACGSTNIELVQFLLEKNLDINGIVKGNGMSKSTTPLDLAIEHNHYEIAKLLRSKGGLCYKEIITNQTVILPVDGKKNSDLEQLVSSSSSQIRDTLFYHDISNSSDDDSSSYELIF